MNLGMKTNITLGLLITLAPAAFWTIDTRNIATAAQADATRAEQKADKALELMKQVTESANDIKWIKQYLQEKQKRD